MIRCSITAELKVIGSHAEFCSQLIGQPFPRGNPMKSHAIGVFSEEAQCSDGMKVRLVVLHEVEALTGTARIIDRICSWPCCRNHCVGIIHSVFQRCYFAVESVKIADNRGIVGMVGIREIVEVNAILISLRVQVVNNSKYCGMAS